MNILNNYTTVFIDRDGTVGGNGHYQSLNDFELFPYALSSIEKLKAHGMSVFALSNQTHIEKGDMDYYDFFNSLIRMGFNDAFICPHSKQTNCNCRKPKKGLIEQTHRKYNFQNKQSIIIGDRFSSDIQLAQNCQMLGIHVATGKFEPLYFIDNQNQQKNNIITVQNLENAVNYILNN
ncbi:HAD-IIIA family hydrolase [Leuconostoc suionicum]|uniref:HAD-IIIA family hydrolase n=1 Tax=Leuconostoc suionicum TaxID=1511761 RepID=UPI0032DFD7E9